MLSLEANNLLMQMKNSALIGTSLRRVKNFKWNPGDCSLMPFPHFFLRQNVKIILLIPKVVRVNTQKQPLTSMLKAGVGHPPAFNGHLMDPMICWCIWQLHSSWFEPWASHSHPSPHCSPDHSKEAWNSQTPRDIHNLNLNYKQRRFAMELFRPILINFPYFLFCLLEADLPDPLQVLNKNFQDFKDREGTNNLWKKMNKLF